MCILLRASAVVILIVFAISSQSCVCRNRTSLTWLFSAVPLAVPFISDWTIDVMPLFSTDE